MKLIGLVPVRNSAGIIAQCLEALSLLCDHIVVLDDCSDDATVGVIKKLPARVKVSSVLTKTTWHRDEPGDRNRLLQEGRRLGGTHFAMVDADEMFTASSVADGSLRKLIAGLPAGGRLSVRWLHPWRSFDYVRWDNSLQAQQFKEVVFRDDDRASYESDFIHTQRAPLGLDGPEIRITDADKGLLHFQYVNWRNVLIKQAWYRCLERVRVPDRSIKEINARYQESCDETGLRLRPVPPTWYQAYGFLDRKCFEAADTWRVDQMQGWFQEHGSEFFRELDIWDPEIWITPSPDIAAYVQRAEKRPVIEAAAEKGALSTARLEADFAALSSEYRKLTKRAGELDADATARADQVKQLTVLARQHEAESALRASQIDQLSAMVRQHEAESSQRADQINQLSALLNNSQADAKARYAQVQQLTALFKQHEAESAARVTQIDQLTALVKRFEGESLDRLAQVQELTALTKRHEAESGDRYGQVQQLTAMIGAAEDARRQLELKLRELDALAQDRQEKLNAALVELQAYCAENDRIARELNLLRRVIRAPSAGAGDGTTNQSPLLPGTAVRGDNLIFQIELVRATGPQVEIAGWAFCPAIDCADANVTLWLCSAFEQRLAQPQPVTRVDVRDHFAAVDLGPTLPPGDPRRTRLDRTGFHCLIARNSLAAGHTYRLEIQIEGPEFSVRREAGQAIDV